MSHHREKELRHPTNAMTPNKTRNMSQSILKGEETILDQSTKITKPFFLPLYNKTIKPTNAHKSTRNDGGKG